MVKKNKETHTSKKMYNRARQTIPGGVNSPVRYYAPFPFFTAKANGSKIVDIDGNSYIDYCMAYGPLILGHGNPRVIEAIRKQIPNGSIFGTPTEIEIEFAEIIAKSVPCVDMIRVTNSGTEATMHAIRLARGFTERNQIVKFEGCYHGAHDYVLVKAGSGTSTFGDPDSFGIPTDTIKNTIPLPFNNIDVFEKTIEKNGDEIAAVILEPVIGNAGVILPNDGFLQAIRKATAEKGILLIFDEVITGFRLGLGGAQEYYNVKPDIVTLGKIIGGGFPIGAFGGTKKIMSLNSPIGDVYQAGTFSGNPISITAGLTVLRQLMDGRKRIYDVLRKTGEKMRNGLREQAEDAKVHAQVNGLSSMFQIFLTDNPVNNYKDAKSSDFNKFQRYHKILLNRGIFVPPSQFETCFLSTVHTNEDIEKTIEVMGSALKEITRG
jgi:glutamate-1-semialdehyde 2,1-aminomutase